MNDQHDDHGTTDKFRAFINSLDAPLTPDEDRKATAMLGALISDKPHITASLAQSAHSLMLAAVLSAKPELTPYILDMPNDAQEIAYIETMRRSYGDDIVDAALDDARTSYRTFYHSLQLRLMAKALDPRMEALKEAFVNFGKAFGAALAKGFPNVPISDAPLNREERRRAKYGDKRLKEGDQRWQRRNNPKRRR